ncbi:MAG: hypothetical protein PVJ38_07805 [Candidatus Bathyarchaeota archaeon]|jgi:hypothetical protein
MKDDLDMKTKTDVLDFVISFIVDHEKRMDQHAEKLERIVDDISRKRYRVTKSRAAKDRPAQPGVFSITVHNPEEFEKIRSIKVEWEESERRFYPERPDIDSVLRDIDYTLRDY